MGKKILVLVSIIFLSGLIFFIMQFHRDIHQVCFHGTPCFAVEVASDAASRQKGLMLRTSLEPDKGMLFVFDTEGEYSFWMKNTLIPLDMIWMNADKKIVFIQENAQPCLPAQAGGTVCPTMNPGVAALYVLEVNAGVAQKEGLKLGDSASF